MFIARDKDGDLFLHETKPSKESNCWISTGKKEALIFGDFWFSEVRWEDEEPRELMLK